MREPREKDCLSLRLMRADFVGRMFALSIKDGYESIDFAKQVMTSDYGQEILLDRVPNEYCAWTFLYSGFKRTLTFKKGKTYDDFFMWFAGYLYKYWVDEKDIDPIEVYKMCPLDKLYSRFGFYHTQGWNYIIADIMDKPFN